MIIYDKDQADRTASDLRKIADAIDRGEVKYVAMLTVFTIEGARRRRYIMEQISAFIESIGIGEYVLTLGALRDFYLEAEAALLSYGRREDEPKDQP